MAEKYVGVLLPVELNCRFAMPAKLFKKEFYATLEEEMRTGKDAEMSFKFKKLKTLWNEKSKIMSESPDYEIILPAYIGIFLCMIPILRQLFYKEEYKKELLADEKFKKIMKNDYNQIMDAWIENKKIEEVDLEKRVELGNEAWNYLSEKYYAPNVLTNMSETIQIPQGVNVLDLGCGGAAFTKIFAEKYNASVVGIDISGKRIEYGRERTRGLDVTLYKKDLKKLDTKFMKKITPKGGFDYIISTSALHTLTPIMTIYEKRGVDDKKITKLFKTLRPFLKQTGRVVISDHYELDFVYQKFIKALSKQGWKKIQIRFFEQPTGTEGIRVLKKRGK